VRLEGLGQLKKINFIRTRTRDLPASSIVPQLTTLPRAPAGELSHEGRRHCQQQEQLTHLSVDKSHRFVNRFTITGAVSVDSVLSVPLAMLQNGKSSDCCAETGIDLGVTDI
jgi:hypothetical protein